MKIDAVASRLLRLHRQQRVDDQIVADACGVRAQHVGGVLDAMLHLVGGRTVPQCPVQIVQFAQEPAVVITHADRFLLQFLQASALRGGLHFEQLHAICLLFAVIGGDQIPHERRADDRADERAADEHGGICPIGIAHCVQHLQTDEHGLGERKQCVKYDPLAGSGLEDPGQRPDGDEQRELREREQRAIKQVHDRSSFAHSSRSSSMCIRACSTWPRLASSWITASWLRASCRRFAIVSARCINVSVLAR